MIKQIQFILLLSILLIGNSNNASKDISHIRKQSTDLQIKQNVDEVNKISLLKHKGFDSYLSATSNSISNASTSINLLVIIIGLMSVVLTIFAIFVTISNSNKQYKTQKKLEDMLEQSHNNFMDIQDKIKSNIKYAIDLQVSSVLKKELNNYNEYFKDKLNEVMVNTSGSLLAIESIVRNISKEEEVISEARDVFFRLIHTKDSKVSDGITRLKQKMDGKEWIVNEILFKELWNNIPENIPIKANIILKNKLSKYFKFI